MDCINAQGCCSKHLWFAFVSLQLLALHSPIDAASICFCCPELPQVQLALHASILASLLAFLMLRSLTAIFHWGQGHLKGPSAVDGVGA